VLVAGAAYVTLIRAYAFGVPVAGVLASFTRITEYFSQADGVKFVTANVAEPSAKVTLLKP